MDTILRDVNMLLMETGILSMMPGKKVITVKFLKIQSPKIFTVITLKFEQSGSTVD